MSFFTHLSALTADTRTENIDVFVLLDKSLSMVEEIGEVKEYITDSLLRSLLIPGDHLIVMAFYGKTEMIIDETVVSDADKSRLIDTISKIQANGRFTDIGNALDSLHRLVSTWESDRRRYLLLITDGIQEAPKDSIYYTPDGSFNHEFLINAKTIQMSGWKIQILGIGTETAARKIAEELSGIYAEIPGDATAEEISERIPDFLGVISLEGRPVFTAVGRDGSSSVMITLRSEGYSTERIVEIGGLTLEAGGRTLSILRQPVSITIPPRSSVSSRMDVILPGIEGSTTGILTFVITGDTPITPGAVEVEFEMKTPLPWMFIAIAGGCALIVLLVILITVRGRSRKRNDLTVVCEIGERIPRKERFTIGVGEKLYLGESRGVLGIRKAEPDHPIGLLTRVADTVTCAVLDTKSLFAATLPDNILGRKIRIRKSDGSAIEITFSKSDG